MIWNVHTQDCQQQQPTPKTEGFKMVHHIIGWTSKALEWGQGKSEKKAWQKHLYFGVQQTLNGNFKGVKGSSLWMRLPARSNNWWIKSQRKFILLPDPDSLLCLWTWLLWPYFLHLLILAIPVKYNPSLTDLMLTKAQKSYMTSVVKPLFYDCDTDFQPPTLKHCFESANVFSSSVVCYVLFLL